MAEDLINNSILELSINYEIHINKTSFGSTIVKVCMIVQVVAIYYGIRKTQVIAAIWISG